MEKFNAYKNEITLFNIDYKPHTSQFIILFENIKS